MLHHNLLQELPLIFLHDLLTGGEEHIAVRALVGVVGDGERNVARVHRDDFQLRVPVIGLSLIHICAGRAVDKVFVAEGAHIGDVAAEARRHRVPVVTCDRRKLDGMSPTGNHQGVIAQDVYKRQDTSHTNIGASHGGTPMFFLV